MASNGFLIIVPTYNEAESAPRLISSVLRLTPEAHILIVDDGSPDGTADICQEIADFDERVHVMRRADKQGLGSAYIAGFGWGLTRGFAAMVEMDADGSHRPEDLLLMLESFESDSSLDLVIGSRWVSGGTVQNWARNRELLSRGANRYAKTLLGIPINDVTAGFRVYRATLLSRIDFASIVSEGYCFQIEMTRKVLALGGLIHEIPITFVERQHGVSKMTAKIVIEAMLRVTMWGLLRPLGVLRRK